MSIRALCVGHASWDLCMYVDAYPGEDTKAETSLLIESGGGPAANAAWLLARWGVPSALAAAVGQDKYGSNAVEELVAAGVDCRLVDQRDAQPSPVSFIIINRTNGSRTIVNRKASASPLDIRPELLQGLAPDLLLFDGHELEAAVAAMEAFPRAITVLDAGSMREGTVKLAGKVEYLVGSERFASQVTGETDVCARGHQTAERLQRTYGNTVVITLGAKGAVFHDGKEHGHIPALHASAIDTTAAGDIFHGAFAFGLLQGMALPKLLNLANVAAGFSVQRTGGRHSAPLLATVLDAITNE